MMVMSDKTEYKYTCTYCGKTWTLSYRIRSMTCTKCKDTNIKCEEIKIKDYYGKNEKVSKNEIDNDDSMYWRD